MIAPAPRRSVFGDLSRRNRSHADGDARIGVDVHRLDARLHRDGAVCVGRQTARLP
jgi:hypothetical protein